MLNCDETRDLLALDPASDDPEIDAHLAECHACGAYRRMSEALDTMLRPALHWQAPTDLTASLLAIAANPTRAIAPRRPSRWYVNLVYLLTVAIVSLSVAIAWHFLGAVAAQLGLGDMLTELVAMPARGLQQLTLALPESRYALDFFLRVRDQLLWLLAAAVIWATLERSNMPIFARQQAT
jgi:predicted anti-sigma-YlaC factor YlaD